MGSGSGNDRYVVRSPEGWAVVKEDQERASALTDTQQEAIDRAKEITGNLGGGEVRVQNRHGEFRGERVKGKQAARALWRHRQTGSGWAVGPRQRPPVVTSSVGQLSHLRVRSDTPDAGRRETPAYALHRNSPVSRCCGNVSGMGAGSVREHAQAAMHSPVNWALLGLVIERPSYAYELARRFERTYEGALTLSSVSHVYTALATLRERGLVVEAADARPRQRSRRRYEPTADGVAEHSRWLIDQVSEERRRQRLLVSQLGALARSPERALEVLDRYEQACLAEIAAAPPPGDTTPGTTGLVSRLIGEETRLSVGAKLRWAQYARAQLLAMAERQPAGPRETTP